MATSSSSHPAVRRAVASTHPLVATCKSNSKLPAALACHFELGMPSGPSGSSPQCFGPISWQHVPGTAALCVRTDVPRSMLDVAYHAPLRVALVHRGLLACLLAITGRVL